ncbi:MAG: Spi family protease inhibitor [Bacteroides sp.]
MIVSGDDELNQVLGYSSIGSFSMDGAPDNLVT